LTNCYNLARTLKLPGDRVCAPHGEARLEAQRAKLAAGEPIRCECCFKPIDSPEAAVEKHGSLVHAGDCEREWGDADDDPEDAE
jgi:hypothetical protein